MLCSLLWSDVVPKSEVVTHAIVAEAHRIGSIGGQITPTNEPRREPSSQESIAIESIWISEGWDSMHEDVPTIWIGLSIFAWKIQSPIDGETRRPIQNICRSYSSGESPTPGIHRVFVGIRMATTEGSEMKTFTKEDLMLPLGNSTEHQWDSMDSHRSNRTTPRAQKGTENEDIEAATESKSITAEPLSYTVAAEKFRDIFQSSSAAKALERIRKELKTNPDVNSQLIHFITEGSAAFNNNLYQYWNTMSIISMFMAIIAATIAVGFTDRFSGIDNHQHISGETLHQCGRAFFVLWATTAITNFASLVINLMAINQYKLMLHDDDMVWFISTWSWCTISLPWLLVIFGALTAVAGVVVGMTLTADLLVTSVVAGVSGLLVLTVFILWLSMISYNKDKEREALTAIRRVLLKRA